jgi:anti-sigma factor RsiW
MTAARAKRQVRSTGGSRDCRARLDQLFAWLDDELPGPAARTIERHVSRCEHCGGLADDLRRAIAACRIAGDCRVPEAVHRRARARARALIGGRGATAAPAGPRANTRARKKRKKTKKR